MDEFVKMVEVYKWRGGDLRQNKEALPAPRGEEESSGSGCIGLPPPDGDDIHSSPSPSLLQNVGHDVPTKVDLDSARMSDRALSFAPRPRQQRHLAKKKPRSLHSRSSRQLVFSVEDVGAKASAEGRVKSKKVIMKDPRKRKRAEMKQEEIEFVSQVEACNLQDFYDDSECDNGPKEFYSPDLFYSSRQLSLATGIQGKVGSKKKSNYGTGKSPYFMHSKQKAKMNGANKAKDRLTDKPEVRSAKVKPRTQRQRKNGFLSRNNAVSIKFKQSACERSESSDWEISGEQSAYSPKQHMNSSDSCIFPNKATSRAKESVYFEAKVKALGQRDIANTTWVPPISVHALIQEELYQDPWKVLVACMLLNKTSGTQMRKIIWDLFALCPTPEAALIVETSKIEEVIRHLGLQNKRARMIQKFSEDYLGKDWSNVGQLHGIGKYGTDAYAIFCEGRWREVEPEDHKLVDYWKYLCATDGLGYAFKDDREKGHQVPMQVSSGES